MKPTVVAIGLSIGAMVLTACTTTVTKEIDGVLFTCPGAPGGKITAKDGHIDVYPPKIPVCHGDSVTLTFKNPMPGAGKARTRAENPADPNTMWLNETYDGNAITIKVPIKTQPNGDGYKYTIEVDGIGRLDPRIVVE